MGDTARSQVINMFTLAIADGFVSPEELTLVYKKGKELGLRREEVDEVIQTPHRVAFEVPTTLVGSITSLYDLARVVVTDGRVDPREVDLLRSYAVRFGISASLIDQVVLALVDEVRAGTPRDELVAKLTAEVDE